MSNIDSAELFVGTDLGQVGPRLNASAQQIEDELVRLRNQLQPVLDSWDGEAKTYFDGLKQEWDIAAAGLFGPDGVLGQIAQAMHINWGNYVDGEWANVQTWKH